MELGLGILAFVIFGIGIVIGQKIGFRSGVKIWKDAYFDLKSDIQKERAMNTKTLLEYEKLIAAYRDVQDELLSLSLSNPELWKGRV